MFTPVFFNKVVWITGASSGIGEQLVYAFNSAGAKLIISARREAALQQVKSACPHPEDVFVLPMDLSSADMETTAALAQAQFGCIDYLVHNAGITAREMVADTSEATFRQIMETNFFGPVKLTQAVLPYMLEAGMGHVTVISSLSGVYGVPRLSAYAASKHALHGFFESMRAEVQGRIHISMIIPGFIHTPIILNGISSSGKKRLQDLEVNEKGMPAHDCAQRILSAIAAKKTEALIGGSEMITVYLHRWFPSVMRSIISRHPLQRIRKIKNLFKQRRLTLVEQSR